MAREDHQPDRDQHGVFELANHRFTLAASLAADSLRCALSSLPSGPVTTYIPRRLSHRGLPMIESVIVGSGGGSAGGSAGIGSGSGSTSTTQGSIPSAFAASSAST